MSIRIGIAGVGGIGSNVAVHLVRAGHTCLRLVDFDRVELSNLNRQFYFHDQVGRAKTECLRENLLRVNAACDIELVEVRLDGCNMEGVFADCPVIVEGFDSETDKKLLLETFGGSGRAVVAASGIAGQELHTITSRRIGTAWVVGDFVTDCREAVLYSPKISIIAAVMADKALSATRRINNQVSKI